MINAYKAYWKRYFDFKGRTSRSNFWWAILGQLIVSIIVGFLARMLDTNAVNSLWSLITLFMVSLTLTTASLLMNAEAASGGFGLATIVFGLLALIVAIYFIILFVKQGVQGANRYGMPDEN